MPPASGSRSSGERNWRAPAFILSTLAAGLALALGHHYMGVKLNNTPVEDVAVSQAWIFRFSTALAFLVKTTLAIAIGTAYVQQQWLRFHQDTFSLADVDALTSILGNVFSIFDSKIWLRNLKLTVIAIVLWAIPLAAVVAPGSLTVQPLPLRNTTNLQVPQPIYNQTNFANLQTAGNGQAGNGKLTSGDARIYRMAYHAAASGEPVPLASTFQNQSYHLQFDGPAVKCMPANDSLIANLTIEYGVLMNGGATPSFTDFIAWAAGNELSRIMNEDGAETLDYTSIDAARVFVMTNTGNWTKIQESVSNGMTYEHRQVNITECILHNASYEVDFEFEYPRQSREVQITDWLNPVATIKPSTRPNEQTEPAIVSYSTVMDAFGKILVGKSLRDVRYGTDTAYLTSWKILRIDWSSGEEVARGLEQLFQNVTLSLLSDEGLTKDATSADFVPVRVTSWPITYVYQQADLLLAYGLAIFSTLGCSMLGLYAFFANGSSYQNIFSTYVRATNGLDIRAKVRSGDTGADPLPKLLARAEVVLGKRDEYMPLSVPRRGTRSGL